MINPNPDDVPNPSPTSTIKRLHISPLTPDLLSIILPSPEKTVSVSYHTLQTFPERSYGYVNLPIGQAEKVVKKFHGSILRGLKMKVSEARPERKRRLDDADAGEEEKSTKKKAKKEGKRSREGALPGLEIEGRKVKRGWTEPEGDVKAKKSGRRDKGSKNEKKSKVKASSYTTEPELLFKTKIPPNATPLENSSHANATSVDKGKKKKKKGKSDGGTVIHEFTHTTKAPSFLRDSQPSKTNGTSEYIDGKGWVDSHGTTLEAEPTATTKRTREKVRQGAKAVQAKSSTPVPAIEVSRPTTSKLTATSNDEETSSSGSSPSSSNAYSSSSSAPHASVNRLSLTHSPPPRTTPPPPPSEPSSQPTPHPLETLFKRPLARPTSTPKSHPSHKEKPNLEVSTSFTFFPADNNPDPSASPPPTGSLVPQTPYTQMDIRQRRQRSAAPTPDTAMPGKSFFDCLPPPPTFSSSEELHLNEEDHKEKEEEEEEEGKRESAFAREFWEKRGERNRLAKRRVREAKKEVRQRENRRGGRGQKRGK